MKFFARLLLIAAALVLFVETGCIGPPKRLVPLDPLPMRQAVGIVNDNLNHIGGTLRAIGSVDGHFTMDKGQKKSFHLEGVLFFLAPSHIRFDLRSLGSSQFLFGSNAEAYWYRSRDEVLCGRHDDSGVPLGSTEDLGSPGYSDGVIESLPVRPQDIIEALGLNPLLTSPVGADGTLMTSRISDEHHQILYLVENTRNGRGGVYLRKEYWLDRYSPRLVRRVLFRDVEGRVTMDSSIDDYRSFGVFGFWLPYRMAVDWPGKQARLEFSIRKWTPVYQVKSDSIQFTTPSECFVESP